MNHKSERKVQEITKPHSDHAQYKFNVHVRVQVCIYMYNDYQGIITFTTLPQPPG